MLLGSASAPGGRRPTGGREKEIVRENVRGREKKKERERKKGTITREEQIGVRGLVDLYLSRQLRETLSAGASWLNFNHNFGCWYHDRSVI